MKNQKRGTIHVNTYVATKPILRYWLSVYVRINKNISPLRPDVGSRSRDSPLAHEMMRFQQWHNIGQRCVLYARGNSRVAEELNPGEAE